MIVEKVVLHMFASFYTTATPPTFTTGLNWPPLECLLPVVNAVPLNTHSQCELGTLRTLATGSDCSKGGVQWISFKIGDDWGPLERSLPVVTVLRGDFQMYNQLLLLR